MIEIKQGKSYVLRGEKEVIGPMRREGPGSAFDWSSPNENTSNGRGYWTNGYLAKMVLSEWVDTSQVDVKEAIMKKAMSIVTGSRRSAYGTPEDNFERIARFWQAYFENMGRGDVKITAQDVSPMMRLMKEARLCNSPSHPDSFTDLVGYALTGAEMNGLKAEDFD